MDSWPNQEALNKALNIYRASMRSFIISHLRRIPGTNVEDVVIDSVGDWRADEIYQSLIESCRDIESVIDINDFPHLVNRNWEAAFERTLNDDKTFRNQLWLIVECRNANSHPHEDAESESTRAHLFLIADVLGKIKRPEKKGEVEIVRDDLFADDIAERLADTEKRLKELEAENAEYKKLLSATLEKKVDIAKQSTQDSYSEFERKSPQKTHVKSSTMENSQEANILEDRVEIGHNAVEIYNDLSTIAERFLGRTTFEDRVKIGRKVAALRINAEGSKGMAWRKIREELRRTEGLHLEQEDLREVIRREDHFKESVVERIESFEGGWQYSGKLNVLLGFEPIGEWANRIEACKPAPKVEPKEDAKSYEYEGEPLNTPIIRSILNTSYPWQGSLPISAILEVLTQYHLERGGSPTQLRDFRTNTYDILCEMEAEGRAERYREGNTDYWCLI